MHGKRRRWVGAEWVEVRRGVFSPQPNKESGGAGSRAEPRLKTDFGVFWSHRMLLFVPIWQSLSRQFALASPTPNSGGLVPCILHDIRPWRWAVVDVPSVRRHIRCGTDRLWVVTWKCAVSSPVSVEEPQDCSTETVPRQQSSAGQ